jgi:hypothetical protein
MAHLLLLPPSTLLEHLCIVQFHWVLVETPEQMNKFEGLNWPSFAAAMHRMRQIDIHCATSAYVSQRFTSLVCLLSSTFSLAFYYVFCHQPPDVLQRIAQIDEITFVPSGRLDLRTGFQFHYQKYI